METYRFKDILTILFFLGPQTKNCHVQGASSESFGGFKIE